MEHIISLKHLQEWMQNNLIHTEQNIDQQKVETYIKPGDQLSPQQCLRIYQNSYELRLIECMRKKFTALHSTLGSSLFDEFSSMYLQEYPSNSPSLTALGSDFPAFLEKTRPDKEHEEQWIDFMIAMAQFEIDLYQIFDQEGSENMVFADQDTLDDQILLQKAFGLRQYPFDVHHYYRQISKGEHAALGQVSEAYLAFVRRQYHVYVVSLEGRQFFFLSKLQSLERITDTIKACADGWGMTFQSVQELWNLWKVNWIKEGFFIVRSSII
jgi:hypothetical protein